MKLQSNFLYKKTIATLNALRYYGPVIVVPSLHTTVYEITKSFYTAKIA